jgi:hypothetical protein
VTFLIGAFEDFTTGATSCNEGSSAAIASAEGAVAASKRSYRAPCVVLVINDNPYGLMVALIYMCRTCP